MRSLLVISFIVTWCLQVNGQERDSAVYNRGLWLHGGINLAEYMLAPKLFNHSADGFDLRAGVKLFVHPRFGIDITYGRAKWNTMGEISSTSIANKDSRKNDPFSNGFKEPGSVNAHTNLTAHMLKIQPQFVLQASKYQRTEAGIFYAVSLSRQDLIFLTGQPYYGITSYTYNRSYTYHTVGLALEEHLRLFDPVYMYIGAFFFYCPNPPHPFDEIIPDYYKSTYYIPGLGVATIPFGFNIGLECRLFRY